MGILTHSNETCCHFPQLSFLFKARAERYVEKELQFVAFEHKLWILSAFFFFSTGNDVISQSGLQICYGVPKEEIVF